MCGGSGGKAYNAVADKEKIEYIETTARPKKGNEIYRYLVLALSLGFTEEEFWNMTPFQLETHLLAREEKFRYDKSLELLTLNTIRNLMSKNIQVTMDDLQRRKIKRYRDFDSFKTADDYEAYLRREGVWYD